MLVQKNKSHGTCDNIGLSGFPPGKKDLMAKPQQQKCLNDHPATSEGYCTHSGCTYSASNRNQAVGGKNQGPAYEVPEYPPGNPYTRLSD
ncbi:predicted protein [Streptomyces sp. AA4]|nr:predicted protein [Streptomyces sp. AA4]